MEIELNIPLEAPELASNEPEPSLDPIACSCVKTARAEGVAIPYGTDAFDLEANSPPRIGGVILLRYVGGRGEEVAHIAVIKSITDHYWVAEGNFNECERGERRIELNDPHIFGYWYPPEWQQKLYDLAWEYGQDPELARRIVQCESGGNKNALNKNIVNGEVVSMDHSLFQINDVAHSERTAELNLNIMDWEDNLEFGMILMRDSGTKQWYSSKSCWDNLTSLRNVNDYVS